MLVSVKMRNGEEPDENRIGSKPTANIKVESCADHNGKVMDDQFGGTIFGHG